MRQSKTRTAGGESGVRACAGLFILSLALVHGMVASTLLVECLPGDGSSLVELVGNDPCHFRGAAAAAPDQHNHPQSLLGEGRSADPCIDLNMDQFGVTVEAFCAQPPSSSTMDLLISFAEDAGGLHGPWAVPAAFKLAREPVPAGPFDSAFPLSLRI